jgi:cobyrinic acid a,c-diamide synthase
VILNRVGSPTHETMLREAIEPLGVPLVGALRRDDVLSAPDRHLGLVPVAERHSETRRTLNVVAQRISTSCDLEGILRLAASAGPLHEKPWVPHTPDLEPSATRVAVAGGPAFSFVYEENLELLRGAGGEISFFDPTSDETLPEGAEALYLGGGFPETYAGVLSENEPLRKEVRKFAGSGRPVAAECGGLLYLCRKLDGREMCGVLAAEARMTDRLSLGYRKAWALASSPLLDRDACICGHEFHYSTVEPQAGALPYASPAWELSERGEEGFVTGGVHASYLHTHWAATPEVPRRFLRNVARNPARIAGVRA